MSVELLDVIQPSVFKGQLAAGSVTDTVIQAGTKGLVITLKIGKNGFVLGRTRGGIRYFHAIDGAASVLIQHGITSFFVDTNGWLPRTLTKNPKRSSPGGNV